MGIQKVCIDQSGIVNKTDRDTALVYCPVNSQEPNYTILIEEETTAKVHSRLKQSFKQKHRKNWFGPKMFAISLFHLLQGSLNDIDTIHMEEEYPGHMDAILDTLNNFYKETPTEFDREKFHIHPQNSKNVKQAHKLANKVREREQPYKAKLNYQDFRERLI